MTIFQLQERLHNTAFSGAGLIDEDFRLHKAIEEFSVMAPKNPVFTKIYQTIKPLSDSSVSDKTTVLLDAITLVDAVCTTMAQTASPESAEKQEGTEYTDPCQKRYSDISDIVEALTTRGSGRFAVVFNKRKADINVFKDYRLEPLLWKAIDDNIYELGIQCGEILIELYGKEAVDKIISQIEINQKTPAIRRISLLSGIKSAQPFLMELILNDDALLDIRRQAVGCIALDQSEFSFYENVYEKYPKLREAVISGTSRMEFPEAVALYKRYKAELKAAMENK